MLTISAEVVLPAGIAEVELASPSELYGLRVLGSQLVVVPSGVPLEETEEEHYGYELDDPSPGTLYGYYLKVIDGEDAFYVPSYICSLASESFLSSASTSDSDSEAAAQRSVSLRFEQSPPAGFQRYRGDSIRVRVSVIDHILMAPYIFGHVRRLFDEATGLEQEDFSFIVSPVDPDVYPVNEPNPTQTPPFYRKQVLDVLLPSQVAATRLRDAVKAEVDNLVAAHNRRDALLVNDTETIP